MAYNPYAYSYNPYYTQPAPDQLTQLRQMQPTTPMAANTQSMLWVSGRSEADAYLVAPNSAVALWDATSPIVYLRQADATGKPSTVAYDLVERSDAPPVAAQAADMSRYITRDELEEILAERLRRPSKATAKREEVVDG